VADGIRLVVSDPGEFALLFGTWTILGAPLYLALRRRLFGQVLR
jgi:hypothetical protein